MKPEAQRIAIAEACGWARTILDPPFLGSTNPRKGIVWCKWEHPTFRPVDNEPGHDPWHGEIALPDYLNDLNAMHEAEMMLTDIQWALWANEMYKVLFGAELPRTRTMTLSTVLKATAAQRAEAFLKTIGKWEESS